MHRLIAVLLGSLGVAFGASGCGSGPSCSGTFTPCGGNLVGTWAYQITCGTAALATTQCPGASMTSPQPSGTFTFNADGTYSLHLTTEESGTETVPASCLAGVTSCNQLDSTISTSGIDIAVTACSGDASQGCTCTVSESGTLTETGTYTTAGNGFTTTASGGAAGAPTEYCVMGATLLIGAANSTVTYTVLTKQ
jgi:hypothetical protein